MTTLPPVISVKNADALKGLDYDASRCDKAAIIPFFMGEDGMPRFVVYAPVPQRDPDCILPYQIARGTMRSEYQVGEKTEWQDRGRGLPPEGAIWLQDEDPALAALREGEEELGLPSEQVERLYDCGVLAYENPQGEMYGLHVFLARIPHKDVLMQPDPAICAARLDDMTYSNAVELANIPEQEVTTEHRPFKDTYLQLLHTLENIVVTHCANDINPERTIASEQASLLAKIHSPENERGGVKP
jgi:hypothetical protein